MKWYVLLLPTFAGLCVLLPGAARASDLAFSFGPGVLTTTFGTATLLTFRGTLTDTSVTQNVFLSQDQVQLSGPGLTNDDSLFYLPGGVPLDGSGGPDGGYSYLSPGQSVTIGLFTVSTSASTPAGAYFGRYEILGGEGEAARDAADPLLSGPGAGFTVVVQAPASLSPGPAVPEDAAPALLGLGLLPLGLRAARRRARV